MTRRAERFWEIDFLRGAAIIMMVAFHIAFDFSFLGILSLPVFSLPWRLFAYATASLFILLSGISFTISYSRSRRSLYGTALYSKYLFRGALIIGGGMIITIATLVFLSSGYIIYGVLHFLGTMSILSPLLAKLGRLKIPAALLAIAAGWMISGTTGPAYLLPLGITPAGFGSFDYVPMLPWSGMFLIGMAAGDFLYPNAIRRIRIPESAAKNAFARFMAFLGRNSLVIYLIHQPVILFTAYLLTI
jgi:uncharacterized membrane protein